jgi:hypothetical protein
MTERPILFSAPMIRALLEGRKTQTRRVLKTQPIDVIPMKGDKRGKQWVCLMQKDPPRGQIFTCRYGVAGNKLWVKETFRLANDPRSPADDPQPCAIYRADDPGVWGAPWKSPLFMPRKWSRLTLTITDVRVQRVQDISEADARSEGCGNDHGVKWPDGDPGYAHNVYRRNYCRLWDYINGKKDGEKFSWSKNPFVWAISFVLCH